MDRDPVAQTATRSVPPRYERILYGLPCANCHSYYAAALGACPICKCPERVRPAQKDSYDR
jgi:hypothetical protein